MSILVLNGRVIAMVADLPPPYYALNSFIILPHCLGYYLQLVFNASRVEPIDYYRRKRVRAE